MTLVINGQEREVEGVGEGSTVAELVIALGMEADRVALERNGEIVSRVSWAETQLQAGDRLEIVHFVGGGSIGSQLQYVWLQPGRQAFSREQAACRDEPYQPNDNENRAAPSNLVPCKLA